jgi:TM2 domain-containing membrane protein YozV
MSTTSFAAVEPKVPLRKAVMWENDSHSLTVGYLLWLIGFTGAHRFYYGRPLTGLLWFCTFGLLGIGWIVDAFLIPAMDRDADYRFISGNHDYGLAWLLLALGGIFGLHRFYQGKFISGIVYLLTGGLFLLGYVYDVFTLNSQLDTANRYYRAGY